MNRIIKALAVASLFASCTSTRIDFFEKEKKVVYTLNIPRRYKKQVQTDYHGKKVFYFMYNDGSILYLTNDGTGLTTDAKEIKYGKYIYDTMYVSDSIDIEGRYQDYFWRESKRGSVVIGFINIDSSSVAKFGAVVDKNILKNRRHSKNR